MNVLSAVRMELQFGLGLFPRWTDRDWRLAWHALGPEILADHMAEYPMTRPAGWWRCEAPAPFDGISEPDQLARLGLLTEAEQLHYEERQRREHLAALGLLNTEDCHEQDE
jgi:hypothetical protein